MPIRPLSSPLLLSLAALYLSGCAVDAGQYPSLDRRPVERAQQAVAPPSPVAPLSPALPARLDALLTEAQRSHAQFMNALPAARRRILAGAGAGVGSDAWSDAQIARAGLESARSAAAFPLAELDLLLVERAADDLSADVRRIADVRAAVADFIATEDQILHDLTTPAR